MELPMGLRAGIEALTGDYPQAQLLAASRLLTERYQTQSGQGKRLLTRPVEAAAYAAVRMPATFGAIDAALAAAMSQFDGAIATVLDAGAGTGAAAWAAAMRLDAPLRITCFEREEAMIAAGQSLAAGEPALQNVRWLRQDITRTGVSEHADLVVASYALNELDEASRVRVLEQLWAAADQLLLLVEPGTPVGYAQLRQARSWLIDQGGFVAAPCPHGDKCPMEPGDWCHFTCRVARSRLHRQLKGGDAPYEDEKFSFLAVTKQPARQAQARVLRHPVKGAGHVTLQLCTREGIQSRTVSRKDGSLFKKAGKAACGDRFDLD